MGKLLALLSAMEPSTTAVGFNYRAYPNLPPLFVAELKAHPEWQTTLESHTHLRYLDGGSSRQRRRE